MPKVNPTDVEKLIEEESLPFMVSCLHGDSEVVIAPNKSGAKKIARGTVCKDCYFECSGEELEVYEWEEIII